MSSAGPGMPAFTNAPDGVIDAERLSGIMKAFGNPLRIEILRQLKWPRTLGEIRVHPARRGGGRADRAINRVTVKHHLDQLLAIGAIQTKRLPRGGQVVDHYLVDHRQLFVLGEELHKMARIRPQGPDVIDGTVPAAPRDPDIASPGAKLVLVNGTYEGLVFLLAGQREAWTVGRRREATVSLDYDPYVSLDHARIERTRESFVVQDVPTARNRTQVNWRPLEAGGSRPLRRGDIVGIGRSLLLFLDG